MSILDVIAADPNVAPTLRRAIAPSPINPERVAYELALRRHDWSHEFSDDGDAYRRGRAELQALREMQPRVDPKFALWNSLCPAQCRDGQAYC